MKQKLIVRSLAAAGMVGVLGFGASQFYPPQIAHAGTETVQTVAPNTAVALPDFSKLVEQNGPAVVNISVVGNMKTSAPRRPISA